MATQKPETDQSALFELTPIEMPAEAREIFEQIAHHNREIARLCGVFAERFPKPGTVNPTTALVKYFDSKHVERFDKPALIQWGRDGKIMKALHERYGEDDVRTLIDDYFRSGDNFIVNAGYTINVFQSMVPRLIAKRQGGTKTHGVTRNTERNAEYGDAAVGMIQQRYGNGRTHRR